MSANFSLPLLQFTVSTNGFTRALSINKKVIFVVLKLIKMYRFESLNFTIQQASYVDSQHDAYHHQQCAAPARILIDLS